MRNLFNFLRSTTVPVTEAPKADKVSVAVSTELDSATFAALFKAGQDFASFKARMAEVLKAGTDQAAARKPFRAGFIVGYMRKHGSPRYTTERALLIVGSVGAKGKARVELTEDEKKAFGAERQAWSDFLKLNGIESTESRGGKNNPTGKKGRPEGTTGGAVNAGKDGETGNVEPNPAPTPDAPDAPDAAPDAPKVEPVLIAWPTKVAALKGIATNYATNLAECEKAKDVIPSELADLIVRHNTELGQMLAKYRKTPKGK